MNKTHRQSLAALVACLLAGYAIADDDVRPPIEYPKTGGVDIGQGWDSQTVQPKNATCITQFYKVPDNFQKTTSQMKMVTDQSTMSSALDISAEVQVRSIAGYSAGVKMDFAKDQKVDSSFISVAHLMRVDNGWKYAAPLPADQTNKVASAMPPANAMRQGAPAATSADIAAKLKVPVEATRQAHAPFFDIVKKARTPSERSRAFSLALAYINHAHATGTPLAQAAKPTSLSAPMPITPPRSMAAMKSSAGVQTGGNAALPPNAIVLHPYYADLSATNPDEFRRLCGDSFVQAINEGGELAVRYTFMTRSAEEQATISAAVTASADVSGVNVTASTNFKSATSSYNSSGQLAVDSAIIGGSGLAPAKDIDGINALVGGFASAVQANPAKFSITITDYSTLPNYGGTNKMAPLTNLQRLAWEFGKADALLTTTMNILNDIDRQGQDSVYVLSRWGGDRTALDQLRTQLASRRDSLQNQAKSCFAAKDANSSACLPSNPEQMDDLSVRTNFPLPLQPGRAADMLNAVYGDLDTYRGLVYDFWIVRPNTQRCGMSKDSLFCRRDDLSSLKSQVKGTSPAVATLSVQGQNGRCWDALNDSGRMFMQPCPLNAAAVTDNVVFAYERLQNGFYHLTTTVPNVGKQCVTALYGYDNSTWVAAHDCGKPKAQVRAYGQEWSLAPAADGQSFQVVSTNPAFINRCIQVWTDGNATGLSDCSAGTRFKIGHAYPATKADWSKFTKK
ncbi:MAG: hypothetical protein OEL88_14700 [Sterolibacteriaceae bacterium MAG5]|nr:hypothetical protein [Candidatus Nitricoxidireducens bremensis]